MDPVWKIARHSAPSRPGAQPPASAPHTPAGLIASPSPSSPGPPPRPRRPSRGRGGGERSLAFPPCNDRARGASRRRPFQYSVPKRTIGKRVTLRVWTRVSASKSSSRVPSPPGRTTNPCAYFTNIVLRTKK
ncbi:hypothetical protein LSPH26S_02208 [Lysinibacillus sphaericus]